MKKIYDPIVLEFNTSDEVKRLTDIRANVSKDEIIVTYITPDKKKQKFVFEYYKTNNIEYIKNKDEYNSTTWSFIAQQMANAVYHLNGGKGSLFDLYDPTIFSETTIQDGLIYNTSSKEVMINIKANVASNIYGKYKTLKDDVYIKDEDIVNLASELDKDKTFKYNDQDIKIYVKNTDTSYEIYSALSNDNAYRSNLSVANIIKKLKPAVYETLNITDTNIIFETNTSTYSTQYNVVFSESGIFETNDKIFKLTLFK